MEDYVENSNEYYDLTTNAYLEHWDEHFHLFKWSDEESREQALKRTNKILLEDGEVGAGSDVVDLGCGVGAFARCLAEEGCNVLGVNVNEHQLDIARKSSSSDRVSFVKQDIMELDLDETFDSAYLIGVDPHLPSKGKAVRRILEHLRPGGRLVINAWLKAEECTFGQQEFLLNPLCDKGGFAGFSTFKTYMDVFDSVGVEVVKSEDWTADVRPCVEDFYDKMFDLLENYTSLQDLYPFISSSLLKTLTNGDVRERLHDVFLGPVYLKMCFDADVFKLGHFVLEK